MIEIILENLVVVGLLGIVLALIALANTVLGLTYNVGVLKKPFDIIKLRNGFIKAFMVYLGAGLLTIGAVALPMVIEMTGLEAMIKIGDLEIMEAMEIFSVTAIAGIVLTVIVAQGKEAINNLLNLVYKKENAEIVGGE